MPRIRTVKPSFYRHELLQELESLHPQLHPMLFFSALWGHCDKNGVFEWAPKQLALDIIPFLWEGSIGEAPGRVLELLWEAKMVDKGMHEGKTYGIIQSFKEHQRISGKEQQQASKFPDIKDLELVKHQGSTGEAPVKHPESQEVEVEVEVEKELKPYAPKPNGFDAKEFFNSTFWPEYPKRNGLRVGKGPAAKVFCRLATTHDKAARIMVSLKNYAAYCGEFPKDAQRWLPLWEEFEHAPSQPKPVDPWDIGKPRRLNGPDGPSPYVDRPPEG